MLGKLLKYDMKPVFRVWWILALSVLALSVLIGIGSQVAVNLSHLHPSFEVLEIFAFLTFYMMFFGYFAFPLATCILVQLRFYRNFFTDEGYLTFTLPVKRSTLFLSKFINALFWDMATIAVCIVSAILLFLFAPVFFDNDPASPSLLISLLPDFFQETIPDMITTLGGWLVLYIVEILILIPLSSATNILFLTLCITVGSVVAQKHKLLAAIGIYYGAQTVLSFFLSLLSFLPFFTLPFLFIGFAASSTGITAMLLAFVCIFQGMLCVTLYLITLHLLERRLNLA
ncbi:MAG: hypothetical protein E7486_05745 [Ruminococcaceae bacterium]|nr:hypothetical protein [Oscillospiraceae bacterium]